MRHVLRQRALGREVDVPPDDRADVAHVGERPARGTVEGHRPVAVVASARLRQRERDVIVLLAETNAEEVADGNLDARRVLTVPVHADDDLAVRGDDARRRGAERGAGKERHPEPVDDARALIVEKRQRRTRPEAAEVEVATERIGAARVLGAASMGHGEAGEPAGPERQVLGYGYRGGEEPYDEHDRARRHAGAILRDPFTRITRRATPSSSASQRRFQFTA